MSNVSPDKGGQNLTTKIIERPPPPASMNFRNTLLPWQVPELVDWRIVGMNHYHTGSKAFLYVSMTRENLCITAEGPDNQELWDSLVQQATAIMAHGV